MVFKKEVCPCQRFKANLRSCDLWIDFLKNTAISNKKLRIFPSTHNAFRQNLLVFVCVVCGCKPIARNASSFLNDLPNMIELLWIKKDLRKILIYSALQQIKTHLFQRGSFTSKRKPGWKLVSNFLCHVSVLMTSARCSVPGLNKDENDVWKTQVDHFFEKCLKNSGFWKTPCWKTLKPGLNSNYVDQTFFEHF